MRQTLFATALAAAAVAVLALAQQPPAAAPAAPATAPSHFHHVHLNVTDPAKAMEFYTSRFAAEKARFLNLVDAVWTQKSWLLFQKVNTPPPSDIVSAIWHIGWGAEDMNKEIARQKELGTQFQTDITDISDIGGGNARGVFFYAYVDGPEHVLIELNTARHHNFGHVHLFSEDPVAAGEWYVKHFGASSARFGREKRMYRGIQIGPSASLMMDNVNIIIFPVEYPKSEMKEWKDRTSFESTKGRAVDHIGFSVDNLDESIGKLRAAGVKIAEEPRSIANGRVKYAFVEGPDKIRIEVIEGHAKKE